MQTQVGFEFLPQALQDAFHTTAGRTFKVTNPATGEAIATIPDHGAAEAHRVADAAVKAFDQWKNVTPFERSSIMRRWFNLMIEQENALARLMSMEMGKPVAEARGEVRYAAGFVEWYAEEAKRVYGDTIPPHAANKRLFAIKQPVGPVYAITPWNFPAAMITRKAAPALAAGCSFVSKPAEQSPLTALYLAYLWEVAGGPADVFQVITTSDPVPVSKVFMEDLRIRKLTFTGSTEIGKLLYSQSAATMKRISLELGGHAPFLIFADAELPLAVKEVVACKFRNAGQTCVCTNRIYVQEPIYEAFSQQLAEAVRALRVGDPLDETTQIGPLIDENGLAKVKAHLADAMQHGAKVLTGGNSRDGLYFDPTVLIDVQPGMLLMNEETFGPIAPVLTFKDTADAIQMANDTPYGLASYLYTRDIDRAIRVAEALEYGIVGLNDGLPSTPQAPFGGVKESGLGREGGKWGIEEYLNIKYISLALH
ncbi:MAG: NAD-dependent succinate-semialdehyde dehydrogenase [Chloroflexota bacterium]